MTEAVRRRLMLQGFACDSDPSVASAAAWLRFTPALSTLCIITGTVLPSPVILWAFAVLAGIGALGWHAFDQVFNAVIRGWVQAPALPPNPAPRRFAMAVAAVWSGAAGLLIALGLVWEGIAAGALLAGAGFTVATTHFCLGSWLYRRLWNRSDHGVAT